MAEMAETAEMSNFDELKGNDCVFVADRLGTNAYTSCVLYLKVFKNDLYIEDITRWREDLNFMFLPREHKIHLFFSHASEMAAFLNPPI